MKKPRALILDGNGLNCGDETEHAFKLAGADPKRVHINKLKWKEEKFEEYHVMAVIGGFSRGDDHGAGVIEACNFKFNMNDQLHQFIDDGNLIIGICNGFQMLANLGVLPAIDGNYNERSVALTYNDCGNFQNRWVNTKIEKDTPCVWTKGIEELMMPIRHAEGKFYADKNVISTLFKTNQVVLRYYGLDDKLAEEEFPYNPNGSLKDIAGICDPTGHILGLMPHPEAALYFTNYRDWTKKKELLKREEKPIPKEGAGRKIFENAVQYSIENLI